MESKKQEPVIGERKKEILIQKSSTGVGFSRLSALVSHAFAKKVGYDEIKISEANRFASMLMHKNGKDATEEVFKVISGYVKTENDPYMLCTEACRIRRTAEDNFYCPTKIERYFEIKEFKSLYNQLKDSQFDAYFLNQMIEEYFNSGDVSFGRTLHVMKRLSMNQYSWNVAENEKFSPAAKNWFGMIKQICFQKEYVCEYVQKFCNSEHTFEQSFASYFVALARRWNLDECEENFLGENHIPKNDSIVTANKECDGDNITINKTNSTDSASKLTAIDIINYYDIFKRFYECIDVIQNAKANFVEVKNELAKLMIDADYLEQHRPQIEKLLNAFDSYRDCE